MTERQNPIHRGRKARKPSVDTQIRRIPADFGWQFFDLLYRYLDPYLGSSQRDKFKHVSRKRDMSAYLSLGDEVSAQWSSGTSTDRSILERASVYLLAKVLSKTQGMESLSGPERRKACLQSVFLMDSELSPSIFLTPSDPVLLRARFWCRKFMGEAPDPEEIAQSVRHGPGSTADTSYSDRSAYFKYADWPYGVSPDCRALFKRMITNDARWLGSLEQDYRKRYDIPPWAILNWSTFWSTVLYDLRWNVVTSVPKNGAKDRPIAKEPLGNVYCQTALGTILKRRFSSFGFDLTDQSRNRLLAKNASSDARLTSPCTLDLSNASDTIHQSVVDYLVSTEWLLLLRSVRSEYGLWPNRFTWRYAKMSSMGNATTFELESIIFASVLYAVSDTYGDRSDRDSISVFGDDLVFPRYLAPAVRMYLEAFGFQVNSKKSFVEGFFFESCGTDWFEGRNIRPMFLRRIPESVQDLMVAHNQINIWFLRTFGCWAPRPVSEFFQRYALSVPLGPLHTDTFDGWFFSPEWKGRSVRRIRAMMVPRSDAKDFWFRKLMHDLRHCDSDRGSRFTVTSRSRLNWSVWAPIRNDPNLGVVDWNGVRQDLVWPRWEELPPVAGQP